MLRRQMSFNSVSAAKKRKLSSSQTNFHPNAQNTAEALSYISLLFPVEKFQNRLPRIVMRHQIYALIKCRTEVDKCLNEMRKKGEIRLFQLGPNECDIAVLYLEDFKKHVKRCCSGSSAVGNFINIVTQCPDSNFSKNALVKVHGMKDENISELIQEGVLTASDVGCYWLAIPQVGEFVKTLLYGRRVSLQSIRRTKYKELLQDELEKRKLPKKAQLSMLYHIYDLIGSDAVVCVPTSTGVVLRLQPVMQS